MACGAGLSAEDYQPLMVKEHTVKHVPSFPYLGSLLSPDARFGTEIDRRLACASRTFGALECVFRDKNLSHRTKRLVYSACVVSTLLYGSECWTTLRQDEKRLDAFHHRCLRAVLGISRWDQQLQHISNADLRHRWGDCGLISDVLRKRRLQWLGHVARMPEYRLPKRLLFGWLPKTRPSHGPRLRWKDRVQADLQKLGVTNWYNLAHDRHEWRSVCRRLPQVQLPRADTNCEICDRSFKSQSGLARHKCTAQRRLPVSEQLGARQCLKCDRWFKSAGGLAVHKCILSPRSIVTSHGPVRVPDTSSACCAFHCQECQRCFKSAAGFKRHNCERSHRVANREDFQYVCEPCKRRFRRASDLKRHRCKAN